MGFFARFSDLTVQSPIFFSLLLTVVIGYVIAIAVHFSLERFGTVAWKKRKIQKEKPRRKDILFDFKWSMISMVIWIALVWALSYWIDTGKTRVYSDVSRNGMIYFIASTILVVVLHDTFFYWVHRFIHSGPFVYRLLHSNHHHSTNPTTFAIYTFTPLEAVVLGSYAILVAFILPVHWYTLVILLAVNTTANIIGHSGYEMVPKPLAESWLGSRFCVGIHHNLHHQDGGHNFGIYFHFWDDAMKTMHPKYEQMRKEMYANWAR